MVAAKYRTKSLKKAMVRIVGGKNVLHFKLKHSGKSKCANCGITLFGVPHSKKGKLNISYKKPSRKHGGNLCSKCVRAVITGIVEGMVE